MNTLIERLKLVQETHNWSDATMAQQLGISRSYWVRLRLGSRAPGRKVLVGLVRSFPDLADAAISYLRNL